MARRGPYTLVGHEIGVTQIRSVLHFACDRAAASISAEWTFVLAFCRLCGSGAGGEAPAEQQPHRKCRLGIPGRRRQVLRAFVRIMRSRLSRVVLTGEWWITPGPAAQMQCGIFNHSGGDASSPPPTRPLRQGHHLTERFFIS